MGQERPKFTIRIEEELLEMLDELRRHEKDVPTRAEMMRRLIMRAGEAAASRKVKTPKL